MIEIVSFIFGVLFGLWAFVQVYKIGRKHGVVIGRAQLAKEITKIRESCHHSMSISGTCIKCGTDLSEI